MFLQVAVPVAVGHIVNGLRRSVDRTGDSGVPSRPAGEILEVGTRLILVALEAIVEGSVGLVEGFIGDPRPEADGETFLPGVHDVKLPNRDAVVRKTQFFQTFPHQGLRDDAFHSAPPGRHSQVLAHVHTKILEC